jgi:hypothetical protein
LQPFTLHSTANVQATVALGTYFYSLQSMEATLDQLLTYKSLTIPVAENDVLPGVGAAIRQRMVFHMRTRLIQRDALDLDQGPKHPQLGLLNELESRRNFASLVVSVILERWLLDVPEEDEEDEMHTAALKQIRAIPDWWDIYCHRPENEDPLGDMMCWWIAHYGEQMVSMRTCYLGMSEHRKMSREAVRVEVEKLDWLFHQALPIGEEFPERFLWKPSSEPLFLDDEEVPDSQEPGPFLSSGMLGKRAGLIDDDDDRGEGPSKRRKAGP